MRGIIYLFKQLFHLFGVSFWEDWHPCRTLFCKVTYLNLHQNRVNSIAFICRGILNYKLKKTSWYIYISLLENFKYMEPVKDNNDHNFCMMYVTNGLILRLCLLITIVFQYLYVLVFYIAASRILWMANLEWTKSNCHHPVH